MKLVTVATHSERYYPYLIESCKRYNAELIVLGWGKKWEGFTMRFNLVHEYLNNLDDNEIICFIDAYDVILLNPLSKLEQEFKKTNANIAIALDGSEKNIFIKWFTTYIFGSCKNININAGTYIGYVKDIKVMLNDICTTLNCNDKNLDDQKILTEYCKHHEIYIDQNRDMFLTYNFVTEKFPYDKLETSCILHAPGDYNIDDILIKLNYDVKNINHQQVSYYLKLIHHHLYKLLFIIIILTIIIFILFKMYN
jgi:hypothetical protein